MMKKLLTILVTGVLLTSMAGKAFAVPITLNEVGVNNVAIINGTFKQQMNGTYNVYAGYYQLSINGASAVNGFCVDPAWAPKTPSNYDLRTIDPNSNYAKAAYLFSKSNPTNAAAVQVAIWEIVMGNDFTWNTPDPTLHDSVNFLLTSLSNDYGNFDLSRYSIAVNPGDGLSGYGIGYQDYIVNTPVPEPGTIMLLGLGLLGLAVFGKRRLKQEA